MFLIILIILGGEIVDFLKFYKLFILLSIDFTPLDALGNLAFPEEIQAFGHKYWFS